MIARLWHGTTPDSRAEAYLDFLIRTGIPDYRQTPGYRGAQIFMRKDGEAAHFLLISLWDSMESIRGFTSPEVDRGKDYPEEPEYLLNLEPHVVHHDVAYAA